MLNNGYTAISFCKKKNLLARAQRICIIKRNITWKANDEMNQNNEGHLAAFFSFKKRAIWSLKLLFDLGGGNGGGTIKNTKIEKSYVTG